MAIVTALPATVTALAGLVISLKNGKKADAIGAKADVAAVKQQEIHVLVNSSFSKVKDDLAATRLDLETAKAEIAVLHGLIRDLTIRRVTPP